MSVSVRRCRDADDLGREAAAFVADRITKTVKQQGFARVVLATGASQFLFLKYLTGKRGIPWDKVTLFHLDEYVGLDESHPASFEGYLKQRFLELVFPKPEAFHFLDGSAGNPEAECKRYTDLLEAAPIDIACVGIGENGHLAFNDPPVCDFLDRAVVKVVELDQQCRLQQLGEGWFPDLTAVPTHAFSMTVPAIMRSKLISCVVPDARKAQAVRAALEDDIRHQCPSSILRTHPNTVMWLDPGSSYLLRDPLLRLFPARIPGFVDLQVNGAAGIDFSASDGTLTVDAARSAFRVVLSSGCVAFLPTVISSTLATYQSVLPVLATAMDHPEFTSRVLGIHLEGPFLSSADGARGCHCANVIQEWTSPRATASSFMKLQELARGRIKIITLAADAGAEEVTAAATSAGVKVLLGHQLECKNLDALAKAGAVGFTHLGNGCPATGNHRHNAPLLHGLGDDSLPYATVIADGVHLPPHVLRAIIGCKTPRIGGGVVLVSDCNPWVGSVMSTVNNRPFGPQPGMLVSYDPTDGSIRDSRTHGLAGSGATVLQCANYLLSTGLASAHDIVRMGYEAPLELLGLSVRAFEDSFFSAHPGTAVCWDAADAKFKIVGSSTPVLASAEVPEPQPKRRKRLTD